MNYIIFGGSGFIGTHLADLISEVHPDDEIWSLDLVAPSIPERKTRYVQCDVRTPVRDLPFTPSKDDVIFNLAAIHRTPGHPDYSYFETNIKGAENVCSFAEKNGIENIVFTSSIAPYGADEELKREDSLPTPNTPYGISKLVAEKSHIAWCAGGLGRKLTVLRPGVVFGKGENGNFTRLYRGIKKHTFAYPGRKDTIKACIYVKELVRFILWNVEERESKMDIFNCCYEPAFSIEQIVNTIKAKTGLKGWTPFIPNALITLCAWGAKFIGSPMGICPERVKKLQISTNISGEKMMSSGYDLKWTFEEAVSDWLADNDRKI